MDAYGTAAAIAQAIGGKKTKALERFAEAVRPKYNINPEGKAPQPTTGPRGIHELRSGLKSILFVETR